MKESSRNLGKFIRGGVAGAALLALGSVACAQEEKVSVVKPQDDQVVTLSGEDFEIKRIGETNVFLLSGTDREGGVSYISKMCKISAIGTWDLSGRNVDHVAVTVSDGKCLDQ